MSRVMIISDEATFIKLLKTTGDKLICVLFVNKNPASKILQNAFEQFSNVFAASIFCIVDIESLPSMTKYVLNNQIPSVDFYYMSQRFCNYPGYDSKELEQTIRRAEQHIIQVKSQQQVTTPVATQTMPYTQQYMQATQVPVNQVTIQQLFQIFLTMQQLGYLKDFNPEPPSQTNNDTIVLADGSKLVKLADGRYAHIKNSH